MLLGELAELLLPCLCVCGGVVGPLRGYPFLGFLLLGLAVAVAVSAGRLGEAGASGMGSWQ